MLVRFSAILRLLSKRRCAHLYEQPPLCGLELVVHRTLHLIVEQNQLALAGLRTDLGGIDVQMLTQVRRRVHEVVENLRQAKEEIDCTRARRLNFKSPDFTRLFGELLPEPRGVTSRFRLVALWSCALSAWLGQLMRVQLQGTSSPLARWQKHHPNAYLAMTAALTISALFVSWKELQKAHFEENIDRYVVNGQNVRYLTDSALRALKLSPVDSRSALPRRE